MRCCTLSLSYACFSVPSSCSSFVPGGGSHAPTPAAAFRGGRRRRAIGTKSEQRHATLFCYIMLNVLGSAVWLRLIPSG